MLVQVIPTIDRSYAGMVFLVIGVGAILLGRDPNGLINYAFRGFRALTPRLPLPSLLRPRSGVPQPYRIAEPEEHESVQEAQVAGHGVA
jgi:hypothetical protein